MWGLGPQSRIRDSSKQISTFLISGHPCTCLITTIQGPRPKIPVLERDVKIQHVPERVVSWLGARGLYLKPYKWGGFPGTHLGEERCSGNRIWGRVPLATQKQALVDPESQATSPRQGSSSHPPPWTSSAPSFSVLSCSPKIYFESTIPETCGQMQPGAG